MIALELGTRVADFAFDRLPAEAVDAAKAGVLDTVGVILAGARSASARLILEVAEPGEGAALVFGRRRRVGLLDAALVNGTASHALDFDDCSNTMGGHPSAPVLPALWALAETVGASGADVLTAYVAGFEVETKIGRAVNFHHYEKGWHPTATLGTFGAAAACSRLLGLPPAKIAVALAIAASMASGLKANFGTMTKPYHVGHCARNGLLAARLAERGMTANPEAFEHPQGFLNVLNGPGTYEAGRIFDLWAAPLDVIEPGIAFKQHPCCASTHPAIDALLVLRREHGLRPEDVVSIRSWTHPRRLRHTNRPDPRSGLDAKFSVQYTLARAMLEGRVALDHFRDDAIFDAEVRAMMARVTAEPHPEARMDTTEHFFAEVTVVTANGRTLTHFVDRPVGRDRDHPLPEGGLEGKFEDCATQVLEPGSARAVRDRILGLEGVRDIRDISALLHDGVRADAATLEEVF